MSRSFRLGVCALLALAAGFGTGASPAGAPPPADPIFESLLQQERYVEAMDQAVAGLRAFVESSGAMAPVTLASLERVGRAACAAGEHAIGEAVTEAAIGAYRRAIGQDDPRMATSWITLGRVARIKGQRSLAWRHYQEARRLLQGAGPDWEGVLADLEHAEASWVRKDDMTRAVALYRRSLERQRRLSPAITFQEADTLTWMGWTLGRMGRYAEAESYLSRAQLGLRALALDRHSMNGVIANAFGERLALEGRWEQAEPFFREVTGIFTAARRRYPPGFARRIRPLDGFDALTILALRRGRGEEAWTTLQRSRAAIHLDFARLGLWRERDEEGFRGARALRREILDLRRSLVMQAPDRRLSWTAETWRQVLRLLETRGRLSSLQSRYLDAAPAPEPSVASVQSILGPKSALLGILEVGLGASAVDGGDQLRKEGWLYVLRESGPVVWIPLPALAEQDVGRLRQAWARTLRAAFWPLHVDADPEVAADHRVLARRFIDPALPHLQGIEHLVIEGAMVPYECLIGPDGRMIGDAFDISYVPSALVASMLAQRWERQPARELRSVLAISAAAPHPGDDIAARPAGDFGRQRDLRSARKSYTRSETPLGKLPSLPYAGAEASLVASKFPRAIVLQGPDDVEPRLREIVQGGGLGRLDVVHFAGHSLSDGSPELAGLALAHHDAAAGSADDGILDVEEILLGWDLDARLLTLSGCETARAAGAERGEVLGFTAALFSAGARSVLSSLWPVDDRATAILMDRFYENVTGRYPDDRMGLRGRPMPLARALREAKRHLRELTDDRGRRPFEHPVYWAGFVLMGLPETR